MAKIDYGAVALIPVGDYSASRQYHANELVGYQGSSYVVLQNPPVGTLPANTTYFMLHTAGTSIATASTPGTVKPDGTSTVVDANGAMSVKPSIVQTIQNTADSASKIGNVPTGKTLQSQIDGLEPRVSSSELNLLNLQGNINSEVSARQASDNTLQSNINAEASTRASADSNLQSQINQIIAPSGEAPSTAEVQNARIGVDGVTYDTLGTAIRSQVNNLNEDLGYKTKNLKPWNLVDISKAKQGYSYRSVVGKPLEQIENANYTLIDEVYEVEAGKQYTVNWLYGNLGIYDNTDTIIVANYIDSIPFTVTIPDGGVKMTLFGGSKTMVDIMLVEGNEIPDEYIPHSIFYIESKKDHEQDKILESILHPLKGVKWCAYGDSLTDSATLAGQATGTKNYVDYVSQSLGLNAVNCGVGGTGYMKTENRFVNRVSTIPTDTEVLTVFGSFNDYEYIESSLGVFGDSGTDTIYGCMKSFFDSLFSRCPDIVVGVILPTKWGYLSPQKDSAASAKCDLYVKALTETAEYYNLPILDLYSGSNLRPWDDVFLERYYKDDDGNGIANTVHPLDLAHKRFIAPKVEAFIKRIYHVY